YEYPSLSSGQPVVFRVPPTVKTRVTIIENDGITKHDSTYNGSFQIVNAGRYAVYAIVTAYAASGTSMQAPIVITRSLVALGPSFPTLPSIDVTAQAQVKVSTVGDGTAPDMIAVVE